MTKGSVRLDGVTTISHRVAPGHRSEVGRQPGAGILVQAIATVAAPQQDSYQGPPVAGKAVRPKCGLRSQTFGRNPMQGGADHDDVRTGEFVVLVGDDQIEPANVHAGVLYLNDPQRLPPQSRQDGSRHSAAADRQIRQWRFDRVGHGAQRVRPEFGGDPFPGRGRPQDACFRRETRRLGQAERLGVKAG